MSDYYETGHCYPPPPAPRKLDIILKKYHVVSLLNMFISYNTIIMVCNCNL